ncbi:MAG: F0F1 ATP synthase subunit alpha [bacterium]|nr:F0F1 ATP synthase subunit alpha [bacterium]
MQVEQIGVIKEIRDGIALIEGLPEIMAEEYLTFRPVSRESFSDVLGGMALGFDEQVVKAIIFGDYTKLKRGDEVRASGHILQIPVGEAFLGRVVDPLGKALDGKTPIADVLDFSPIERDAHGIVERDPVEESMLTGIKVIDALIPVGRGQRELIIGDRKIGKTSIALDAIISQKQQTGKKKQVVCIYCSVGQKKVEAAHVFDILRKQGAMHYSIGVVATASDPTSLQYIAPYSAITLAEYFRDKGEDVLVVFDDLTKHAWSWRELSSLLERIPGREGYPGDIFFLHSRLLERAGRRRKDLGGGSITALPIVQTQEGEISGYIPTNVISITDGQIYLEPELFRNGVRPAINVGLSVSRVGSRAQPPVLRDVSKGMRLKLAQYQELVRFGGLETKLEKETARALEEGKMLMEVLAQRERRPLTLEKEVLLLLGTTEGLFKKYAGKPLASWENDFFVFLDSHHKELASKIWKAEKLTEELKKELIGIIQEFTGK